MTSLSLEEKDHGYVLTRTDKRGHQATIWLSEDDLLTLSQSAARGAREFVSLAIAREA
jgi:hypothetical protein